MINGTTGESPTTTDAEKETLLRAVVEAVGDRAQVVAGVGTNDTAHTVELARAGREGRRARPARGHAVLQQAAAGRAARATSPRSPTPPGLPVLLYDIPHRTGVAIATETLVPARRARRGSSGSRTPRATSTATSLGARAAPTWRTTPATTR